MKHTSSQHLKIRSSKLMKNLLLGNFKAAFSGKGIEFQDFRAYSYGDDAKYIDWLTSSRETTTLIRRYKEEKEANILCISDISESLNFAGSEKKKLLSDVVELIGEIALGSGEKLGGYQLYQDTKKYIFPRKSPISLYQLQKKYPLNPRNTKQALSLDFLLKNPAKRSIIFVISDSVDIDMQSFKIAAKKHDLIYISLSSHFENTLEGEGIALLRSQGKSFGIDLDDTQKKEIYREKRKLQLQNFRTTLQKYGIDSLFLDETSSLVKEFLFLMKHRERKLIS